jgi:hypothetical protein
MSTRPPKAKAARRTRTKDASAHLRRAFLREWAGTWATNPKTPQDRKAASLLHAATSFTQAGSVIAPVAVAAIDILGMKALLETMSLEQIATRFAEPFYGLDGPAYRASNVSVSVREMERLGFRRMAGIEHVEISDTILLARRPDWELCGDVALANANAVVELAGYVATVTKVNSLHGIPLRSALAFGECLLSVGGQLALLGAPTREASEWERCQEWAGGMLTQSAIEALRCGAKAAKKINGDDFVPRYPNWLVPYPVPVKPAATATLPTPSIALNWITGKMPGPWMYDAQLPKMPEDARPDVKRKVENTVAFAEYVASVDCHSRIEWG